MLKSGGRICITLFILIIFSVNSWAVGVGTTGANYLKIDPGARSAALGSAYVGLADDINTLYFNPAGIGRMSYASLDTMQLNWLAGITQQQIAGIYPMGEWGVLGGYYSNLSTPYDKETQYDGAGNYDETGKKFNSEIKVVNLTYAKQISSKLSIGLGLKKIEERLFDVKTEGTGLDAGLFYKGFMLPDLSMGLVLQNYSLSPLRAEEPLPQTVILGAAYTFKLLGAQRMTVLGDISFPVDNDKYYGIGLEYAINRYLSFRLGYKDKVGTTLGGGLRLWNLKLNYAYVPYGELGTTYRVSVGYDFDNSSEIFEKAEQEEKEPVKMPKTTEEIFEEKAEEAPKAEVVEEDIILEEEIITKSAVEAETKVVDSDLDELFED